MVKLDAITSIGFSADREPSLQVIGKVRQLRLHCASKLGFLGRIWETVWLVHAQQHQLFAH
jgi:hypothetical protein